MRVFRLARSRFKNDLSGTGARLAGGRWNSIGIPVLYTCESRSLCALEIAVHTPLNVVPEDYFMIEMELPDKLVTQEIKPTDLPSNWKNFPEVKFTQKAGDQFFRAGQHLALRVPSAIVKGDHNVLINPLHFDFKLVQVVSADPFDFDQRLFLKSVEA